MPQRCFMPRQNTRMVVLHSILWYTVLVYLGSAYLGRFLVSKNTSFKIKEFYSERISPVNAARRAV